MRNGDDLAHTGRDAEGGAALDVKDDPAARQAAAVDELATADQGTGTAASAAPTTPPPVQFEEGRHSTWILVVCCVAQFMVILDLSIVNVALPSIQSALNFSSADLQWVVDAYAITFAGFLMLGGRAADHFGQRRTFVAALGLFSLASLAGGAAQSTTMLVVARGIQGFSCAFMAASSLAIITSTFPPGPKLHRAIGLWAAMNGLGGAAGVLFGGIITEALSWRWVLLINPPIGIAASAVAYAVVANRRRAKDAPAFDLGGAVTLTGGQIVLVYGVVKAGTNGWSSGAALGPIIAGVAILILFCVIEARFASAPLVPFGELTKPLQVANTIVVLFSGALFPMWFLSSLYLQQVLGLSPLHAGLTFLPMALTIMLVARRAGHLVSRFGVRAVLGGGLMMMTAGMLLFTKIAESGSSVVYVMIPGILTAAGIGMSIVPSTIAATSGAKPGQTGLASGLVNTSRQVGGGLGLAILITLATQHSSNLIGGGQSVPQALTNGFRLGYYIAAGLCAAAALITFTLVPAHVRAPVPGAAADPESKARRRTMGRFPIAAGVAFVIAAFMAIDFGFGNSHGAPIGKYTTRDTYHYVSAPQLHPPIAKADVAPSDLSKLAPGYIFLANFYDLNYPPIVGQSGPLILDTGLSPVWFKPVPEKMVAGDLTVQRYRHQPVLAWWQGFITNAGATTSGEDVVVDQHYRTIATVHATDGWVPTLHEILIRGHHMWITANKNIPKDLSRYGGAYNGALIDSAVQEYDIPTGKLLYSWDVLGHVGLSDSQATLPTNGFPWDAYHINSIQLLGHGKMLVSLRNTWAAYLVDIKTGHIEWTLGGRHSSFKFGAKAGFEWQHDVRMQSPTQVTMFDDHCCQETGGGTYVSPTGPSRGLTLTLDQSGRTASLASEYSKGSSFDAQYMGSTQPLPGGGAFVGWGSQPSFSEFDSSGRLLLDVVLPHPDLSYRATLNQWAGKPLYPPAAVARRQGQKTVIYASWNGATQLAGWRVLGGPSASALKPLTTVGKSGFETTIPVSGGMAAYQVQAVDAQGRVLGTSQTLSVAR